MTSNPENMMVSMGDFTMEVIVALAILVVGWIVAYVISTILRKAMTHMRIDERLGRTMGLPEDNPPQATLFVSKLAFFIMLLFVISAFFRALGVNIVSEPIGLMINEILNYLPKILGGLLLLLLAWMIASALRFVTQKMLNTIQFDRRIQSNTDLGDKARWHPSATIANMAYWMTYILFLPMVLRTLNIEGLTAPVESMVGKLISYLPNVFGAAVVFVFGWLFARFIRHILVQFLSSVGANHVSDEVGLKAILGRQELSYVLASIVYALILLPTIIAALQALAIDSIAQPATEMLSVFLRTVPYIFGASIILIVTYSVGRLVASLVGNVLTGLGFNQMFKKLGLSKNDFSHEEGPTPAKFVGTIVLIALLLLASIEAAEVLGFTVVAGLIRDFLKFGGNVLLGLVIFGIGLYLGHFVYRLIVTTAESESGRVLAQVARIAVVVLAAVMGIQQMGIATQIVTIGFGIILGAGALAFAIAFGFGAKDIAAREADQWIKKLRGN